MPYESISDVPSYVPKAKRKQWLAVFNSAYERAIKDGKKKDEAEGSAFAQANGVAGPNAKDKALVYKSVGTNLTGFVRAIDGPFRCGHCEYFMRKKSVEGGDGVCKQEEVNSDLQNKSEPRDDKELLIVAAGDCCNEYEPVKKEKSMKAKKFSKFIPFAKVDAAKREVWGIVTAEVPDKDDEVCDYETTKPLYQAVIDEMSKATDGQNFFPLRAMHQLVAAGKCIGFDFRDSDREIFMGFKVVDDDEWRKVDEGVYTGFSHGGSIVKMWEDPVYKDCQRYTADPAEISLVDNPCLGIAHFSYVKTDGTIELRKLRGADVADERSELIKTLQTENEELRKELLKDAKTKRVAGEDLPASAFLIVGDESDPASWKLPVKFSSDSKTKSHLRNALSRFSQVKDVPQAKKDAAWKKLVNLCEKHDIDVTDDKAKLAAIQSWLRKEIRIKIHKISRKVRGGNVGYALAVVDFDLGKLAKGMSEVSRLAQLVEELGWLCYAQVCEQEWEGDADSPLPEMLASNVESILDTLLSMVEEESQEMKDNLADRMAGQV